MAGSGSENCLDNFLTVLTALSTIPLLWGYQGLYTRPMFKPIRTYKLSASKLLAEFHVIQNDLFCYTCDKLLLNSNTKTEVRVLLHNFLVFVIATPCTFCGLICLGSSYRELWFYCGATWLNHKRVCTSSVRLFGDSVHSIYTFCSLELSSLFFHGCSLSYHGLCPFQGECWVCSHLLGEACVSNANHEFILQQFIFEDTVLCTTPKCRFRLTRLRVVLSG